MSAYVTKLDHILNGSERLDLPGLGKEPPDIIARCREECKQKEERYQRSCDVLRARVTAAMKEQGCPSCIRANPFCGSDLTSGSTSSGMSPVTTRNVLRLPIAFHLMTQFDMIKGNTDISVWLTCDQVQTVFSRVNQIWRPAGIQFDFNGCYEYDDLPSEDEADALRVLENTGKGEDGRKAAQTMLAYNKSVTLPASLNIVFIPYIGEGLAGNTPDGGPNALVAVWRYHSRRHVSPEMTRLSGGRGSIAHVTAHEIGHSLGLTHQTYGESNLMGGDIRGDQITDRQIAIARGKAVTLRKRFADLSHK